MQFKVTHLSVGYPGNSANVVIRDASFLLETGQVMCILGRNGAGKTTLLKAIQGLIPIRSGDVLVGGTSIRRMTSFHPEADGTAVPETSRSRHSRASIGYVPQINEQIPSLTILDLVATGTYSKFSRLLAPPKEAIEKARELLDGFGIDRLRERKIDEVSGGEKQLVLIARALMREPPFLVLDEPTSSLDFENQMRVLRKIRQLANQGTGIIMTSHAPEQAFLCCEQVAVIHRDGSLTTGPVQETINEDLLFETYGVPVKIITVDASELPRGHVRTCVPLLF